MGGTWEANIYINNQMMTTIKLENSTPLSAIRAKCNNIIPKIIKKMKMNTELI